MRLYLINGGKKCLRTYKVDIVYSLTYRVFKVLWYDFSHVTLAKLVLFFFFREKNKVLSSKSRIWSDNRWSVWYKSFFVFCSVYLFLFSKAIPKFRIFIRLFYRSFYLFSVFFFFVIKINWCCYLNDEKYFLRAVDLER